MRLLRPGWLALLSLLPSCAQDPLPPAGQLVVWIDTDAPLVSESSTGDPLPSAGLFDRLRIEVLDEAGVLACAACERDFVVSQEMLDGGKISFGVQLPPSRSLRLRARLFPSDTLLGQSPPSAPTIDGLFTLPAVGLEGLTTVTATLPFDALGTPVDPAGEAAPVTNGRALAGLRAVPSMRPVCSAVPAAGEVCVPGGAYWARQIYDLPGSGRRAVIMSPFFIDAREVTVADLRATKLASAADPLPHLETDAIPCTYSAAPSARDDLPVTCASADLAAAYCAMQDKTLPTLAQLEYVRSGLGGARYVWGSDRPTCRDAVWGRGGDDFTCAMLGKEPTIAGAGMRDRLILPTGTVTDVAGNVAEMLADTLLQTCVVPGVTRDPFCGTAKGHGAIAGGSFASSATELLSYARIPVGQYTAPDPRVGFRCVRGER